MKTFEFTPHELILILNGVGIYKKEVDALAADEQLMKLYPTGVKRNRELSKQIEALQLKLLNKHIQ